VIGPSGTPRLGGAVHTGDCCQSCGEELRGDARFCRRCGTRRSPAEPTTRHAAAPPGGATDVRTPLDRSPVDQPHPGGVGESPAPGRPLAEDRFGHPAGYAAGSGYQSPPVSIGYPTQAYAPVPSQTQLSTTTNKGWLVVGAAVATVLALGGVGVGIFLATSGGSDRQARLLAAPVITTAAIVTDQTPSAQPRHTQPSQSSPHLLTASKPQPFVRSTIGQAGERQAVADTVQRHFALISQHQFSAAYALLAPNLQTGESAWVASHREDGIYKVEVAVDATLGSADSATATVARMTTLDAHGCKRWSGSWGLTKIGGQWRISEPNISSSPC
jgi:hypothetical protein